MRKLTQELVDKFHAQALELWDKELKESGKSELMFKISHQGVKLMAEYQHIKEQVTEVGLTLPDMFPTTKIILKDVE